MTSRGLSAPWKVEQISGGLTVTTSWSRKMLLSCFCSPWEEHGAGFGYVWYDIIKS